MRGFSGDGDDFLGLEEFAADVIGEVNFYGQLAVGIGDEVGDVECQPVVIGH